MLCLDRCDCAEIGMPDTADDDRQAIMQLIEDESATYWNRDHDAWAKCWVRAPYIRKSGWWTPGSITYREGWERISGRMRGLIGQPAPGSSGRDPARERQPADRA